MKSLDLRPAKGTILYEFLRLGLVFDHSDGDSQTWMDYENALRADITGADATEVKLTDMTTRLAVTIPVSQLADTDSIITWKSDNPTVTPTQRVSN